MTGASPLPTLEGDSYQSRPLLDTKRDGILFEESVVISVGDIVWSGWVFRESHSNSINGNRKRGLWIEGVRDWGAVDLRKGVVAVLDLAGDCLDCSQVIIHLRNELGETRMFRSKSWTEFSFFVAEFNAFGIPTHTSKYIPLSHRNVNRNDNMISNPHITRLCCSSWMNKIAERRDQLEFLVHLSTPQSAFPLDSCIARGQRMPDHNRNISLNATRIYPTSFPGIYESSMPTPSSMESAPSTLQPGIPIVPSIRKV